MVVINQSFCLVRKSPIDGQVGGQVDVHDSAIKKIKATDATPI